MKIIDVKTHIVGNPPPYHGGPNWVFLKLMTDDNIEGWGECPAPWFREHAFEQLIKDTIKRYVIGEDPFNIERIWESLYQTRSPFVSHHFQHPDTVMSQVNGACEMACWDIIGKTLNQPIYRLIGGKRNEKLRAYTYLYDWRAGDPPDKAGPVAIDDGEMNILEILKSFKKQGYNGAFNVDHLPEFIGDSDGKAGLCHSVAYLKGLLASID